MTVTELIEALIPYGDDTELYIRVPPDTPWGVYKTLRVTQFAGKVFIDFVEEEPRRRKWCNDVLEQNDDLLCGACSYKQAFLD